MVTAFEELEASALVDYRDLVCRMVDGNEPEISEIRRILQEAGRSRVQLRADMDTAEERKVWCQSMNLADRLVKDVAELKARRNELLAELNRMAQALESKRREYANDINVRLPNTIDQKNYEQDALRKDAAAALQSTFIGQRELTLRREESQSRLGQLNERKLRLETDLRRGVPGVDDRQMPILETETSLVADRDALANMLRTLDSESKPFEVESLSKKLADVEVKLSHFTKWRAELASVDESIRSVSVELRNLADDKALFDWKNFALAG